MYIFVSKFFRYIFLYFKLPSLHPWLYNLWFTQASSLVNSLIEVDKVKSVGLVVADEVSI